MFFSVGRIAEGDYVCAERMKKFRREFAGCAVCAIHHDFHAGEFRAGNHGFAQAGEVVLVERVVVLKCDGCSAYFGGRLED